MPVAEEKYRYKLALTSCPECSLPTYEVLEHLGESNKFIKLIDVQLLKPAIPFIDYQEHECEEEQEENTQPD